MPDTFQVRGNENFDPRKWSATNAAFMKGKFLYKADDAAQFIRDYATLSLEELIYGIPRSYTVDMNKLVKELKSKGKAVVEARKKGEHSPEEEKIAFLAKRLREFITDVCIFYAKYAPTKDHSKKGKSEGKYVRSSIMYFTTDEDSRTRALTNALNPEFESKEKIFGQYHVIRQLTMYELFRGKKEETNLKRWGKIYGGITLENVAANMRDGQFPYYYGWKNVEMDGWNGTEAYGPFRNAIAEAKKKHGIRSNSTFLKTSINDDLIFEDLPNQKIYDTENLQNFLDSVLNRDGTVKPI